MLCRLCLLQMSDKYAGIPLFKNNSESRLLKMIAKFLHLELTQDDSVSTVICNACCQHLNDFEKFSTYVEKQQEILRNQFADAKQIPIVESVQEEKLELLDHVDNNDEELLDVKDILVDSPEVELNKLPRAEQEEEFSCANIGDTRVNNDEVNNIKADKLLQKLFKIKRKKESKMRSKVTALHRKTIPEESPPHTAAVASSTHTIPTINTLNENHKIMEEKLLPKLKSDYYNEFIANHMQLKCQLCGEVLDNFLVLKTHFRTKHNCDGYATCCDKQFKKRMFLVDHINYHLNPNCFQCKVCSKCYKNRNNLDEHLKKVHPQTEHLKYECSVCAKKFARKNYYEKHKLKHQTEKNFKCDICNKSFANKTRLSAHSKNTHGEAVHFVCDYCGQEYKNKKNFNRHVAEHEGIFVAPVQCSICKEWLKCKETLHTHMRKHDRINAKCEICNRICPTKCALQAHIKYMHSTERKLVCSFCSKTFKRKGNLQEHMAIHTGEKHHTCAHCTKEFRSKANMYAHIKKDHVDEWKKSKLKIVQN